MTERRFTRCATFACAVATALALTLASCASTKQVQEDSSPPQEVAAGKDVGSPEAGAHKEEAKTHNATHNAKHSAKHSTKPASPELLSRDKISRNIAGEGIKDAGQLYAFFLETNPYADKAQLSRLCRYYVEESRAEGINSDCAFVQMCLETGFLQFGNLVTPEMHNYCGLGATGGDNRGVSFDTERLGVRAHVQHLHAYATTEDKTLKRDLIDPRYGFVKPRGKSPTIAGLSGTWAADPDYAIKLEQLLVRLEAF